MGNCHILATTRWQICMPATTAYAHTGIQICLFRVPTPARCAAQRPARSSYAYRRWQTAGPWSSSLPVRRNEPLRWRRVRIRGKQSSTGNLFSSSPTAARTLELQEAAVGLFPETSTQSMFANSLATIVSRRMVFAPAREGS